jgi:hypothetical protein
LRPSALLLKAVENNIHWCDVVAQSHSLTTHFTEHHWYCTNAAPPLYPNIITRQPKHFNPAQFNDLMGKLDTDWAMKDSFHEAEQVEHAYLNLFSAHWYGYEPRSVRDYGFHYPQLKTVKDSHQLALWVAAWGQTPAGQTIFNDSLLQHENVTFVFLTEQSVMTCGAILFEHSGVMGITNLFGSKEEQQRLVRTIQVSFPEKSLVGYGDDAEFTLLKPFGFHELGKLSVLLSQR